MLGLPDGLVVLHGKTRRGGLVLNAAGLVKDAGILPQAFLSAMRGDEEWEFRQGCIEVLASSEIGPIRATILRRYRLAVHLAIANFGSNGRPDLSTP